MLIINADDWGGWPAATDAALAGCARGRITSVSAMLFMADSERAAGLAADAGIDVGLHVNFVQDFSDSRCPAPLAAAQRRLHRFLKRGKYALLLYHPLLREQFRCVYQAQVEEFVRLYGRPPSHIDGHQHMHLCTNMVIDHIIPPRQKVRRSFSFWPGEKGWFNRYYRRRLDQWLGRKYRCTDYFFSLGQCLKNRRLGRVAELSQKSNVELMTHPEKPDEYRWLMNGGFDEVLEGVPLGSYARL
jgi:predicted glycoside hydrolase/deacetylase ChbG (UPF0249 family)